MEFSIFEGAGLTGDFWFIATIMTFVVSTQYFGFRGGLPYYPVLLLGCLLPLTILSVIWMIAGGTFSGATLGVEIPLRGLGLPGILFFGLAIYWSIQQWSVNFLNTQTEWLLWNSLLFTVALLLLPVLYDFYNKGPHHGKWDQIAVYLTMAQWLIINLSFLPFSFD